ncbi:fimbria/pilus periplasmic chaperone [Neisseriaceae bacterium TC5R-5]|nr:fimbria/pilus periplasmic chaperone [Neisseriaceae bacterium TC5R-5]
MYSIDFRRLLVLILVLFPLISKAGVVIVGTRVIFPGAQREVSVRLENKNTNPVLVQTWLDQGQENVNIDEIELPFILTPPLFKMNEGRGQTVRIIATDTSLLPQDRESVFWLNVHETPPRPVNADEINYLQLAFKTRIKLFYRPAALKNSPTDEDEINRLQWSLVSGDKRGVGVKLVNPNPYYVSFTSIVVEQNGIFKALGADMVAPFSEVIFYPANAKDNILNVESKIHAALINDYGGGVNKKIIVH